MLLRSKVFRSGGGVSRDDAQITIGLRLRKLWARGLRLARRGAWRTGTIVPRLRRERLRRRSKSRGSFNMKKEALTLQRAEGPGRGHVIVQTVSIG